MSKLILHVGTHKTGTTTIQDTFALNRDDLARHGLVFPAIGPANGQHGLVLDWIALPPMYQMEIRSEDAWAALARDHARSDRTVLVSTEELSRGAPDSRVDLRRVRQLVSSFDQIRVVCFVRNQISFLQSIYLQVITSGAHLSWQGYLDGAVKSRMATGLFLDYADLRDYLETGFAPEEIVFHSFEAEARSDNGIIGRMMKECGLEARTPSLAPLPAGPSNVSSRPLATWAAAHVLNASRHEPWLVEAAQGALLDMGLSGQGDTIFTRSEFQMIRTVFDPLNATFRQKEAALGTPVPPIAFPDEESLIFRDRLVPGFWVNLSRRLVDMLRTQGQPVPPCA